MAINPFKILAEFKFDIASAVADSKTLQGQVGAISTAANQTMFTMQRLGLGLVGQLNIFSGGVLGVLHSAIGASERFGESQRKLANIFLSNSEIFGQQGINFSQSMKLADNIMGDIKGKALEFGISPDQLMHQATSIAPMLLSHGLDNEKLDKSIDISRGLLKSAPTLGVDPSLIGGQLINLVLGRAGMENTLFQRLMSETKPFKDAGIKDSKSYNLLPNEKRIDLLRNALLQFGSSADVLAANVNTISGQLVILKTNLMGAFSIFKGFGDILVPAIVKAFKYLNTWLQTHGQEFVNVITRFLKPFLEDPIKAFVQLDTLSKFQGDLKTSGTIAFGIEAIHILGAALTFFGLKAKAMAYLPTLLKGLGIAMGGIAVVFTGLAAVVGFFAAKLAVMVATILIPIQYFMQIFSMAGSKIKVGYAAWLADNVTRISLLMERFANAFKRIMLPLSVSMDAFSSLFADIGLFFITKEILVSAGEYLASFVEMIAKFVVSIMSWISGMGAVIGGFIGDLMNMNTNIWRNLASNYESGFKDYWNKIYGVTKPEEQLPTSQQNNHFYGDIKVNQQFKEQMEPDRVAYSFIDVMKKIAENPTQASVASRGRSVGV